MVLRRINNLIFIFIILCSTGFYEFSFLGPIQKVAEIIGVGLIVILLAFNLVYAEQKYIPHNFTLPIVLILFSLLTSMFMAKFSREQAFGDTLYAQRAIYFYALYFLLHVLKIKPRDLTIIFIAFGFIYVFLFLIQFTIYPTIIFDAYVRFERGTVRIYMAGSGYLGIASLITAQNFYRSNRIGYLLMLLLFLMIIVLSGGRFPIALSIFVLSIFFILDRKVKSRFFLMFLGLIAMGALFFAFQNIFEAMLLRSHSDIQLGQDYVRLRAIQFFLTDFFLHPMAYITGNGMFSNNSTYGLEIRNRMLFDGYFLSDIGIFGIYAIYGAFFLLGVVIMIVKAFKLKIESQFFFIKFFFFEIVLGLLTAASLTQSHFICLLVSVLYIADVSNYFNHQQVDILKS